MTPKLFLAGLFQETIDFSPIPTSLQSFQDLSWRPGISSVPPQHLNLLGYGAVLEEARRRGLTVIPGLFAMAEPGARPRRQDWDTLKNEVLNDLRAALPVDMVFLFLHGAMSAQGLDDCAGNLVAAVREIVGSGTPVAAEFDLHGNMSALLARNATILIACKEYPHIDFPEQGRAALDLLIRTHGGEIRPAMGVARVP